MLAALGVVIHTHTGATDLRIGTMIAGRAREDTEHVIGNFVNIVVIRFRIESEEPLLQLVSRVNAKVAAAMDHQEVPIQDVLDHLEQPVGARRTPLYQVTFALNTMKVGSLVLPGVDCADFGLSASGESTGPRLAATAVDLRWIFVDSAGDLDGTVTYNMDHFAKTTIRGYVQDFAEALRAIARPGRTVRQAVGG
jgi:non-ribosomal peptide synthetase component F